MEPFELSLRQVNLEEKDIQESDTLDSFGNLVCFDEDFNQDSEGLPVKARKLLQFGRSKDVKPRTLNGASFNKQSSLIDQIHESKIQYYTQGQGRAEHMVNIFQDNKGRALMPNESAIYPHYSTPSGTWNEHQHHANHLQHQVTLPEKSEPRTPGTLNEHYPEAHEHSPGTPNEQHHQMDEQSSTDVTRKSSDTFRSFTHTVDALALQSSVIGTSSVSPASPEEVAKVIADTQKRLLAVANTYATEDDLKNVESIEGEQIDLLQPPPSPEHHAQQFPSRPNFTMEDVDDSLLICMTKDGDYNISMTRSSDAPNPGELVIKAKIDEIITPKENLLIEADQSAALLQRVHSESEISDTSSVASEKDKIKKQRNNLQYYKEHSRNASGSSTTSTSTSNTATSPYGENHGKPLIRIPKEDITVQKSTSWFINRGSKACSHPGVSKVSPERESISTDDSNQPEVIETTAEIHPVPLNETSNSPQSNKFSDNSTPEKGGNNVENIAHTSSQYDQSQHNDHHSESNTGPSTKQHGTVVSEINENSLKHESSPPVLPSPLKDNNKIEVNPNSTNNHHSSESCVVNSNTKLSSNAYEECKEEIDASTKAKNTPYVEVDITDSPKNYENRVKELELEIKNSDSDGNMVSTKSKDYKKLKKNLEKLMRAKAKLEGQLEVMETEAKESLQQRADLQSHVAALQQQMKSHESNVKAALGERDAVSYDMLTMKQNKGRLEQVILDAHKLMSDKDEDLKTLNEDLQLAQKSNEALQEKLKELKRQIQDKDTTVQDLKNKITELYVQFQTTNQTKILLENEIRSLKSEVKTLATAKEWYQQQLQLAQESKNQLQHEITNIKGEVITKSTVIEKLKAENVRIKQQIADTQQRVIQEKQLLAQHLEAIEADMLEREATFTQISHERDAFERAIKTRGENPQAALNQVSGAGDQKTESENLTTDLDMRRLGNDIRRKQAQISVLEHEQAELMKRLALSQESILERDRNIETIEKNYLDVEVNFKQLQQNLIMREEDLGKTKQEKSLVESELLAVKAEKNSFDNVIQNLKNDMTKVERSFRYIKNELAKKSEELNKLKSEKDKANEEIAIKVENVNSVPSLEKSEMVDGSDKLEMEATQKNSNEDLQNLKSQNSYLQQALKNLKAETSSQIQGFLAEKVMLENKLAALETKERNSPERKLEIKNLVQTTIAEVETSKETLVQHYSSQRVQIHKDVLAREYVQVGDHNGELEKIIEENNKLKMVVLQMMNSIKSVIDGKVEGLKSELDQEKHDKSSLEVQLRQKSSKEHEHLSVRVKELERELQILRDNEARSEQEIVMSLTLELEKEKGKLAAVMQNYEQLKDHAANLESLMADKESSSVAWNSQTQHEMRGREKLIVDLQENVKMLEATAAKDNHTIKEIKKQLAGEKGGHVKTRRQFETLWVDHDQMRVDYENKIKELENTLITLEKTRQSEAKFRETCEKLNTECQNMKVEMEELRIKVGESEAKDPVVGEHIKSLEWQLKEKEQELNATKQQLQLVEDRQLMEVENLRKTIQVNTNELSKLREDLTIVKGQKTSLQGRNTELKNALQSTVQANKHGKAASLDFSAIEKLLEETGNVSSQSKPLSFLQSTLSDLRGEITCLQTQMDTHATAIQTSSQAWRELEQHVADLREVCKSTAADREASKELLSGNAKAAAQSPVALATQAVAHHTTMLSESTTFIPPIPVKIPENIDFSLPPIDNGIINSEGISEAVSKEYILINNSTGSESETSRSSTPSKKSSVVKAGSEERHITTRTLEPNSVYSPPTPSK